MRRHIMVTVKNITRAFKEALGFRVCAIVLSYLVLAAFLFYPVLRSGLFISGDFLGGAYPPHELIKTGFLSWWNPYMYGGVNVVSLYSFQPIMGLVHWLAPEAHVSIILIFIHVWLAGVGMFLFLRPTYIKDISQLPPPARHLVDIDYFYAASGHGWPFGEHQKTATVMTSRGCPFRCVFCRNSKAFCPPRYNSVENVLKEIAHVKSTYKVDKFYFLDDDLLLPRPRFAKIATGMIPLNIRWGMAARASSITEEGVVLAKLSGCEYIFIGFETNSQKCLDALDKRTTVEDNQRAVDICNKHGIKVVAGFMTGIPGETPADLEETIKFIKGNKFFSIGLCMATPMPGTKLWDYAEANGLLPKDYTWDNFTIGNPKLNCIPNKEMTFDETKKYFDIIDDLCEKQRATIKTAWVFKLLRHYPMAAIKTLWNYRKRLFRYIGRVR